MKHLLVLQLIIVDLIGFAFLVAAWPYVVKVFEADASRICFAIVAVWAFGKASCYIRAVKISRMLDASKTILTPYKLLSIRYKANKAEAKNEHLSFLAALCGSLGFLGTVYGLTVMAGSLQDVAGSAENLTAAIGLAFNGYGIALSTTLVGIIAGMWLEIPALFIATATTCLEKDVAG